LSDNKGSLEGVTLRRRGPPRLLVEPEETEDPAWKRSNSSVYGQVEVTRELLTDNWDDYYNKHNESSPDRNISRSKRPIFPVDRYVPDVASGSVAIVDKNGKHTTWGRGADRDIPKRKFHETVIVDSNEEDRERSWKPTKKSTVACRDASEESNSKEHLSASDDERCVKKVASQKTKIVEGSDDAKENATKYLAQLYTSLNALSRDELKAIGFVRDDTKQSVGLVDATEGNDLSESDKAEESRKGKSDNEES
jgi:hypothetical protein